MTARDSTFNTYAILLPKSWDKEAKVPNLVATDDIIKGVLLTKDGQIVHPNFQPADAQPATAA